MLRRAKEGIPFVLLLGLLLFVVLMDANPEESSLESLVSSARFKEGGGEVLTLPILTELAEMNNQRMLDYESSGHFVSMTEKYRWFRANRVRWKYMGEVACWFYTRPTPGYIMEVFSRSIPHWNVLMNERFTRMGYAITERDGHVAVTIIMLEEQ